MTVAYLYRDATNGPQMSHERMVTRVKQHMMARNLPEVDRVAIADS